MTSFTAPYRFWSSVSREFVWLFLFNLRFYRISGRLFDGGGGCFRELGFAVRLAITDYVMNG